MNNLPLRPGAAIVFTGREGTLWIKVVIMVNLGLDFWLTQWDWEPTILIGTALILGLYLYAIGPFRERHGFESASRGKAVAFVLGVDIIFLALVSPLDKLGDKYLFSAHMVQHLLLTMVGPMLMVIGTPEG